MLRPDLTTCNEMHLRTNIEIIAFTLGCKELGFLFSLMGKKATQLQYIRFSVAGR